MITQKQVDALREIDGIDFAALRPEAIKKLIPAGQVQMRLFDERNLFELTHADFPGERLVACRNPEFRSPDLWENEVAPISVIGTAGEGVDELEVGPGVRQLGGVELG